MSVRLPTREEKILPKEEVEEKNHHQKREGVEMIAMNVDPLEEVRTWKGRTNHQRATQNEDIKIMLVNGYPALTPTITQREVITLITHKYRGSQQFSRVEYSTQIY